MGVGRSEQVQQERTSVGSSSNISRSSLVRSVTRDSHVRPDSLRPSSDGSVPELSRDGLLCGVPSLAGEAVESARVARIGGTGAVAVGDAGTSRAVPAPCGMTSH